MKFWGEYVGIKCVGFESVAVTALHIHIMVWHCYVIASISGQSIWLSENSQCLLDK